MVQQIKSDAEWLGTVKRIRRSINAILAILLGAIAYLVWQIVY